MPIREACWTMGWRSSSTRSNFGSYIYSLREYSPETQAAQAEAWTAGAAYAALLHDIGKLSVDLHVEYPDGTVWHPWHGPLQRPYRFRYRQEREYRLHSAATGLLYTGILDRTILDWLSVNPDLWRALMYVLSGQYEHSGILGDLVRQADQASVASGAWRESQQGPDCSATCLATQTVGWFALPAQGRVQAKPASGIGWLADPGRALVDGRTSLRQTPRTPALARHRRYSIQ